MATKEKKVKKDSYGCQHYQRKCQFLTTCCDKIYPCRFCHNNKENHILKRENVKKILCSNSKCTTLQDIQQICCKCGISFGKYFCSICKIFDDRLKGQFHCDGCKSCRVGGRENYFHCDKCGICLSIKLRNNHKCVEKSSHSNCSICLKNIHISRSELRVPSCGHIIHKNCYQRLLKSNNYACPLCSVSMIDMSEIWKEMDDEIQNTPMPDQYLNSKLWILCRDCHKQSEVTFHVVGLKCVHCGSYNTCKTKGPEPAIAIE